MSGAAFFQRNVVLLVFDFSNWAWKSALLVSLIHGIWCCKYTPSWISQNKKFLYKLIFRDYKIFRMNFNHTFLLFLSDNYNSFYNNEVIYLI